MLVSYAQKKESPERNLPRVLLKRKPQALEDIAAGPLWEAGWQVVESGSAPWTTPQRPVQEGVIPHVLPRLRPNPFPERESISLPPPPPPPPL